jgi:signal transduction histidine kinase
MVPFGMTLDEALLECPQSLRALAASSGVSPSRIEGLVAELARSLRASRLPAAPLDRADAPASRDARERAAGIAAIGAWLSALDRDGTIRVTTQEMSAAHDWARTATMACVEALEADRAASVTREAALRKVFATAEIQIIELDEQLRFRWTHDWGRPPFSAGAVAGHSAAEFLGSDDAGEIMATVRRVLETGVSERADVSMSPLVFVDSLEHGPLNFLFAVEPVRDASGATTGVMCASTNITELKRTQLALREAVGVRDLMMAVLAHDLRNPLSVVRALSRTYAQSESLPAAVRRGLSHVESASKRMNELIGTLLDFSASRAGRTIPVATEPADVAAVTAAVLDEVRQVMPGRRIEQTSVGDTCAVVDPARIAQVVSNLTANAVTHGSPTDAVEVTLDGTGRDLVLAVRNHGPEIPAELLAVLFEPFRRGSHATSHARGLGLGLYITREIVRAHGGTIEVQCSGDRGTVFTMRLPRFPVAAPELSAAFRPSGTSGEVERAHDDRFVAIPVP